MANPQIEKGYIRIANDLWNEILRRSFSKRQLNLILFIWRLSYGTGRKDCIIDKFNLLELAGMYKQDVKKELKFLRECHVLNWDENSMLFSINKNYNEWQITPNKNWDNDKFNSLIYENIKRKSVSETLTNNEKRVSKTLTTKNIKVSKLLTKSRKQVSKTLTLKLVKYLPSSSSNSVVISDTGSLKTLLKTLIIKDIKQCSSSIIDNRFADVMNFYRDNLQRGVTESPFNYELINQWYSEFGSELLLSAMEIAANAEVKGVKYVEGVLKKWREAGVKTKQDADRYQQQFKTSKNTVPFRKKNNYNNASTKKDIVPDWYEKSKKEREMLEKQNNKQDKIDDQEFNKIMQDYLQNQGESL
ncbi:replication protein [Gracilibacillus marinus]|uniref:Replication protein n=1 Tax=Gracilibacillus marinus TaxID=630535 RepID=A0ABV8VX57_9BACI